MKKENWIWMGHPAHFCAANRCGFSLATYVGGYIVSTLGEYVPDAPVREILAQSRNIILEGRGDVREADWMKKVGYEEIGSGRTYETMVFKAIKQNSICCPYEILCSEQLDFEGYNSAEEATKGHYKMCKKWAKVNP